MPETVSLVCTVRNEADNIGALLDSMLAQRRPADEIVVNDCGSSDSTAAIVGRYGARDGRIKLVAGGFNIPSGRNSAVRAARGPLIACTDAGLTLDPEWLGRIVAPLERGEADLVGGAFLPAPRSLWELALGATNYRRPKEIDPASFLAFGKSMAFRKAVWESVGGFAEWASHCEDLLFDLEVSRAGYRTAFAPNAVVHFQPRPSPGAFFRQYFLYARGDGRAGLWGRRHLLRYGVYASATALLATATRGGYLGRGALLLLALGGAAYTRGPYRRLWPQITGLRLLERSYVLALVPPIRLIGDCAKMLGYPLGVLTRHSNR